MISDVLGSSYNIAFEMFIDLLSDPSLLLASKVCVCCCVSVSDGVFFVI